MKTKIKFLIPVVFILMVFLSFTFSTKAVNPYQCDTENVSFAGGEKLVYKLYYNLGLLWIPAGEVTFTVRENKENYELKAIGKTYKTYESIFKVNDYFYSKIDKKTLLPQNFVRIVHEGNYTLYDSIRFDQKNNLAFTYHGKSKSEAKSSVHKFNTCMQDMMSNLYYMRNIDLSEMKKGDKIGTKMFFDKEVFPINIGYDGQEVKNIKDLGDFKTLRIVPDVVEGSVFKKGDHMTIWVSDDSNRIPLLIESPITVGSVKAVLKSHAGLRHKLDASI